MLRQFLHSDPDPAVVFLKKFGLAVLLGVTMFSVVLLYWP